MKKRWMSSGMTLLLVGAVLVVGCSRDDGTDEGISGETDQGIQFNPDLNAAVPSPTPEPQPTLPTHVGSFGFDECLSLTWAFGDDFGTEPPFQEGPVDDPVSGLAGQGCVIDFSVPKADYDSLVDIENAIYTSLGYMGWLRHSAWDASGPGESLSGYRPAVGAVCILHVRTDPEDDSLFSATLSCLEDTEGAVLTGYDPSERMRELDEEDCRAVDALLDDLVEWGTQYQIGVYYDNPLNEKTGRGCRITTGLHDYPDHQVIFDEMITGMIALGWEENADMAPPVGPFAISTGFTQGNMQCKMIVSPRHIVLHCAQESGD